MTSVSTAAATRRPGPSEQILLSPPDIGELERQFVLDALDSGWIAPLGPHVDAFEREMADLTGVPAGVAVVSGTAALVLALRLAGVGPGDRVLVSSLTFVASASPVVQLGATPVFVDCDRWWTIDASLVAQELDDAAARGRLPRAVVAVDLYGQCADHARLRAACVRHGVTLVEDAAEALGATAWGRPAGSLGDLGILSFNGNKTITTSGGGMLLLDDPSLAERARHLATQAREPVAHYEHRELGYNFRMSNILAALGRAQLRGLEQKVARRREIHAGYVAGLGDLPGLHFMPEAPWGTCSRWLTTLTVDPEAFGATRDALVDALGRLDIEARPVWKPMHRQPVFEACDTLGGSVAERLFATGMCLPSGSSLTDGQLARVVEAVRHVHRRGPRWPD